MKKIVYSGLVVLILIMVGCTFHFPYDDWDVNYSDYRVILLVNPDDADVLLDGKLIGAAYEFSTAAAPLRLHSRSHELVIKKEGYTEEAINLLEYSRSEITIRVKLLKERPYYRSPEKENVAEAPKPKPEAPEYKPVPKVEPMKEPPVTTDDEMEETTGKKVEPVNVTLEIQPKESAIYLNGKFWGISPESGIIKNLRLEPGKYNLEIVKPGFKSAKKELDVKDQDLKLIIKLEK
jgi:uncharacterized membrane-anchored protein